MTVQFQEPLFKANFTLIVGDFGEVERHLFERGFDSQGEKPKAAKAIWLEQAGASECVLWFRPDFDPVTPEGAGLLAHEALHGVDFTLKARGMTPQTMLDEVGNYMIEWLVREVVTRLKNAVCVPTLTPCRSD